ASRRCTSLPSDGRTPRPRNRRSSGSQTSDDSLRQPLLRSRHRERTLAQVAHVIEASTRPPFGGRRLGVFPLAGQESGTLETSEGLVQRALRGQPAGVAVGLDQFCEGESVEARGTFGLQGE